MTDTPVSLLEERVDEVIAAFLEAERIGQAPTPDDLLARHPDLADELREFFSDRGYFARFTPPVGRRSHPVYQRPPDAVTVDAGRYVGLEPHARGGLGEVFTATDTELHRRVALKRLQDRRADDAASRRRFLLEAEVTARLEHPGVVPVHSLYRDEQERPCYTMRFIEGQTLAEAIRAYHAVPADPVAFRRLLRSYIQVCETIAYAHSRGVIHRDLKPQNIMLGKFGETMVVDWGLAKVVGRAAQEQRDNVETTLRPLGDSDGSSDQTQMGSAVGTPAYMSPEQAAGRWDVIDAASDVYNLGAVLYALLTGRPPLEDSNWPAMQQKIQRGEFPRPRAVKPAAPRALEAVCLRAMAMKPEDRYPSARELAADIERWVADEPVEAYPEPVTERLWRWMRRHTALVGSAAIVLVVAIVSGWVISLARSEAEYQQRLADQKDEFMREREAVSDRNVQVLGNLITRFDRFEKATSVSLDRIAESAGQVEPENRRESKSIRDAVLREEIEFWDKAIEIDRVRDGVPGGRTHVYRCKRAICVARLGEHRQAAAEAERLAASASRQLSGEEAYKLVLVYTACAIAAKEDKELVERYSNLAMRFLQTAVKARSFDGISHAERLRTDPELTSLRSREDFARLLRQVQAERK